MRTVLMAGLFLAAVSHANAGERSFAFDGHEYSLDFPSSFKFTGRKVQEGVEYVDFEDGPLRLSFSTSPFSPEDVSPEDWKPLDGLRYEAAVNDGDFVMIGGCADEDRSCFFRNAKGLPGTRQMALGERRLRAGLRRG